MHKQIYLQLKASVVEETPHKRLVRDIKSIEQIHGWMTAFIVNEREKIAFTRVACISIRYTMHDKVQLNHACNLKN